MVGVFGCHFKIYIWCFIFIVDNGAEVIIYKSGKITVIIQIINTIKLRRVDKNIWKTGLTPRQ
jgi:hypothetical protein